MNHYGDLLSSWEKLEDEFPLNIPDLLMAVLAVGTLIATGLGVL